MNTFQPESKIFLSNIILSILHKFSSTLFGFLNFFLLIRMLSKSDFGVWSIFLFGITAFELSKTSLIKYAHIFLLTSSNYDEHPKIAGSSLLINTFFSLFFIVCIFIGGDQLSIWLNMSYQLSDLLKCFIPGIVILIFFSHYEAIQHFNNNFKNSLTANIFRQVSFFIPLCFCYFMNIHLSLFELVYFYILSNGIALIVLWILSRKYFQANLQISGKIIKKIFQYGVFMMTGNILSQLTFNIDQLLISRYVSAGFVGYYGIATRVMNTLDIPMNGAAEAMFPSNTKAFAERNTEMIKMNLEKVSGSLFAIIIPIALSLFYFSENIILIIAGENYLEATNILKIYLIVIVINIFKHQSSNMLLSLGKTQLHFIINLFESTSFIILTYILIIEYGYMGAAYSRILIAVIGLIFWAFIMKYISQISFLNILNHLTKFYPKIFKLIKSS